MSIPQSTLRRKYICIRCEGQTYSVDSWGLCDECQPEEQEDMEYEDSDTARWRDQDRGL